VVGEGVSSYFYAWKVFSDQQFLKLELGLVHLWKLTAQNFVTMVHNQHQSANQESEFEGVKKNRKTIFCKAGPQTIKVVLNNCLFFISSR
jgi:hypothetical protein